MLKFLLMTILVFLSVTVMFISHVFLLTKALQCSYDERIFQMFVPPFPSNLTDNSTATRKEMISRLTRCRFGTFLNDEKFVEVNFTSDCITVSSSDGSVQARGTDCQTPTKPSVIFKDNKTVFIDLNHSEDVLYAKDGLYICS